MKTRDFIGLATMGGPGLDGYAYKADTYCPECAAEIIREIAPDIAPLMESTDSPIFQDSDQVPQPIFDGETDGAAYCCNCGEFLYGDCWSSDFDDCADEVIEEEQERMDNCAACVEMDLRRLEKADLVDQENN